MHDQNISWHLWVGVFVTIIPATILVAVRFFARTHGPSPLGLKADDWLILASLIVNWFMAAIRVYEIRTDNYGTHASELSHTTISDFQKSFLAVQEVYFLNCLLTKFSLLYLYHRIFGISRRFTFALWCTAGLVALWFIACVSISIGGCQPVSYFWNKVQTGQCIDEVQFFRGNGITNMILDFIVLVLPLPMVWGLDLGLRQKLVVTSIFMLGTFVCIVSVLRIIAFNLSNQGDPTYTTVDTATWSSVEQSVGIICTCLPTLRPLLRFIRRRNTTVDRTSKASIPLSSVRKGPRTSARLSGMAEMAPSEREILGSVKGTPSVNEVASKEDLRGERGDKSGSLAGAQA